MDAVKWDRDGLVPAIIQDADSGQVLMMAWMNEAALERTMATGETHFYSRSRRKSWRKGETSGHVQRVVSIAIDCDGDVLLIKAQQVAGACHEGYQSCFFRQADGAGLLEITQKRVFDPGLAYKGS